MLSLDLKQTIILVEYDLVAMQTKSASLIEEIFIKASLSHKVTKSDWQKIEYALAEDCVSLEDRLLIRRIKHSVYRGWFRVLGEANPLGDC